MDDDLTPRVIAWPANKVLLTMGFPGSDLDEIERLLDGEDPGYIDAEVLLTVEAN